MSSAIVAGVRNDRPSRASTRPSRYRSVFGCTCSAAAAALTSMVAREVLDERRPAPAAGQRIEQRVHARAHELRIDLGQQQRGQVERLV